MMRAMYQRNKKNKWKILRGSCVAVEMTGTEEGTIVQLVLNTCHFSPSLPIFMTSNSGSLLLRLHDSTNVPENQRVQLIMEECRPQGSRKKMFNFQWCISSQVNGRALSFRMTSHCFTQTFSL